MAVKSAEPLISMKLWSVPILDRPLTVALVSATVQGLNSQFGVGRRCSRFRGWRLEKLYTHFSEGAKSAVRLCRMRPVRGDSEVSGVPKRAGISRFLR